MSTRTRILLRYPQGGGSVGGRAVKELLILTHPTQGLQALKLILRGLRGKSKREKILAVAEKLPAGYSLTLVQEPRGTRRGRSLYWQLFNDRQQAVQRQVAPVPQRGGQALIGGLG